MANNPVEEFLLEKKALNMGSLRTMAQNAKPGLKRVGEAAATAALTGGAAAAFAGLAGAAGKAYLAATKTRDFNNMMEANPDLRMHHEQDPAGFNRLFTAMRTMAPEITREPLVAGTYMRRGIDTPGGYGGNVAMQARHDLGRGGSNSPMEAALKGFSSGFNLGPPQDKKPQLQKQVKSVFKPQPEGEPLLERIEETHHHFG